MALLLNHFLYFLHLFLIEVFMVILLSHSMTMGHMDQELNSMAGLFCKFAYQERLVEHATKIVCYQSILY